MKVRLTPRALQRARIITAWWRKNRPGAEEVFEQEFEYVTRKLAEMSLHSPLGIVYGVVKHGRTIRRVLLPRAQQHLYYSVDEANGTVLIRMVWGARRGRGPKLW